MKPRFVSAMAVLFCAAVFLCVGLFGYSRYKAAQVADEAFRAKLLNNAQAPQAAPGDFGDKPTETEASASPQPAGQ